MAGMVDQAVACVLLAGVFVFAVIRPRGVPEAVPAAVLVVVLGLLPVRHAAEEAASLAPTIAFLAAILLLCERQGLLEAAGRWIARAFRGRPVVLLAWSFWSAPA